MKNHEERARKVCKVIFAPGFTDRADPIIAQAIADATADAVKLAAWYGLLARAANLGLVRWHENHLGWWLVLPNDDTRPITMDGNGQPVETSWLRAAIEQACGEPTPPEPQS